MYPLHHFHAAKASVQRFQQDLRQIKQRTRKRLGIRFDTTIVINEYQRYD